MVTVGFTCGHTHTIHELAQRRRRIRRSKAEDGQRGKRQPAAGEPHDMEFEPLDRYLLSAQGSKAAVVDALLEHRSDDPAAAPFYRALARIGPRAADEALIALRLVLAGKKPADERVRVLRDCVHAARAGGEQAASARETYFAELR